MFKILFDFSKKPLFLAPMAGVTDQAFRIICKAHGADVMVSEMISAKGIYYKDKKTAMLCRFSDEERPFGIQIFGSDPEIMAFAAGFIENEYHPDFIDINMGCPMPKIVNNHEGSALLDNPRLSGEFGETVKKAILFPLSITIRIGRHAEDDNASEFARILEASGADFITVHGRTASQLYSGRSDRESIRKVKSAIQIPVIGNGDITSKDEASDMYRITNCDGLMIGRGAQGNPFIFEKIKNNTEDVSDKERLTTAKRHILLSTELKGERIAIPELRKHLAWYCKGIYGSAIYKNRIFTAKTCKEMTDIIDELINSLK